MARNKRGPAAIVPSMEDWGSEKKAAQYAENAELARSNRMLRQEVAERGAKIEALEKELGLFHELERAVVQPSEWKAGVGSGGKHEAVLCLGVSDSHRGTQIYPSQVDGLNKFDVRIHDQRMERAFTQSVKLSREYIKGVELVGAQVFLPGDMVSGSIHEELLETNQITVAEQIVGAVEPLVAGLTLLAKEFRTINVAATVGNHGRTTKKPRAKFRAVSSYDWLVYRFAERLTRGNKGITWNIPDAADCPVRVYDTKYLLTHGDQFRGGSGISGVMAPLMLGAHRKTRRASAAGRPYDVMVFGHFHQSLWFPAKGLIGVGCICGYDEHAYVSNYEPEPPQASMWLTTPERGITMSSPVFVMDRKAEGW